MLQIPPSAILLNCIGNTLFSERIRNYMGGIKDGHFEAACDKDFKNAELLCTVKYMPVSIIITLFLRNR